MRLKESIVVLVAVVGALFCLVSAAEARPTTKRQAELNVLRAMRVLARWHFPAVDPATRTLRPNTVVTCFGRGRVTLDARQARHYRRFVCRLTYHGRILLLLYLTKKGDGFELRRLPSQAQFSLRPALS